MLLVEQAKEIDPSTLSSADAAELAAAIAEAEKVIDNTIGIVGEVEASEARVTACLVKAGVMEPAEDNSANLDIFTQVSPWLYENFGTDGFSEIILSFVSDMVARITNLIANLF